MPLNVFRRMEFQLRRLMQYQPIAFCVLLAGALVFAAGMAFYLQQLHREGALEDEWRRLNRQAKEHGQAKEQSGDGKVLLPIFDNTQLAGTLNEIAEANKMSLDEISFSLDENQTLPYARYHATLNLSSNYATMRKFLDQVRAKQPEMSLDSISCSRDDIATVELSCDIALSAFYRKGING
jgi:hypothetical protein